MFPSDDALVGDEGADEGGGDEGGGVGVTVDAPSEGVDTMSVVPEVGVSVGVVPEVGPSVGVDMTTMVPDVGL